MNKRLLGAVIAEFNEGRKIQGKYSRKDIKLMRSFVSIIFGSSSLEEIGYDTDKILDTKKREELNEEAEDALEGIEVYMDIIENGSCTGDKKYPNELGFIYELYQDKIILPYMTEMNMQELNK